MLRIVHDADTATPGIAPLDLDELCRPAARELLAIALEAERRAYLEAHADLLDAAGHHLVVGNGSARDRAIMTGAGMVEVRAPRVDDRRPAERFRSALLPPYLRRSPKVTEVLPILYLRGRSTGDFGPALRSSCRRRRGPQCLDDHAADRDLAGRARGLEPARPHRPSTTSTGGSTASTSKIRLEEDRLCCLVIIGVRPDGRKELVAVADGYRESTESWAELLRDLKARGLGGAGPRDRRRRAGLLGRPPRRLPEDPRADLLEPLCRAPDYADLGRPDSCCVRGPDARRSA